MDEVTLTFDGPEDDQDEFAQPIGEPVVDEAPIFDYREDSPNLVRDFMAHPDGRKALRTIGERVHQDFTAAWEASKNYRDRVASDYLLFTGDLPPKTYPHKNAANMHVPMMLENLTRLWARAAGELFGDWTNVVGVLPLGPDDEETADVLTKHANWQMRNELTDFKRQMDRAGQLFFGPGDVTCYSYRDVINNRNRHDILTCDEFVVPYVMASVEPDYSDVPFYVRIMRYHRHELEQMSDVWEGVAEVIARTMPMWDSEPDSPLRDAQSDAQGVEKLEGDKYAPYKILHFEGWLEDIPNQSRSRFMKVLVDAHTKAVLQLAIHEEENWQDKFRYDRELSELSEYRAARQVYDEATDQILQEDQGLQATRESLSASPLEKAEASVQLMNLREQPLPPPPPPPAWMQNPDDMQEMPQPARMTPIRMFSHGVCIEPITGALGMGYGRILGDLNRCANVSMSQFIDSAHFANAWSIITASGFEFEGGFEISPGKHNKATEASGSDIRNSIVELKPGPANDQLLQVAQFAVQYGQSAVQAPDVLSGEAGKSGETYRGISTRVEQATKQLAVLTRKFSDFLLCILKNNAKLNSIYLADEELIQISDRNASNPVQIRVTREMYSRNYQVEFRSDMRFTSQAQRVQEADEVLGMAQANPYLLQNPAFMYEATKRALIARGRQDMIPSMGPPPPPPGAPLGFAPPPPVGPDGQPAGISGPSPGPDQ